MSPRLLLTPIAQGNFLGKISRSLIDIRKFPTQRVKFGSDWRLKPHMDRGSANLHTSPLGFKTPMDHVSPFAHTGRKYLGFIA
jgi:hypothetical protein